MEVNYSAAYVRPLNCQELAERFEAPKRIAKLADTEDLDSLDMLCRRGRYLVQLQVIGSPTTLCAALIRDLTICLGEIVMRYIRADWNVGIEQIDEGQHTIPEWNLRLEAGADSYIVNLEAYVAQRFFVCSTGSFAVTLEEIIKEAQAIPGLYLGGYSGAD